MKAYVLSIAGVVLLSAVLSIVVPSGKMGKFIKGGMKLAVLLVLVSPFVTFFIKGEFPIFSDDTDKIVVDAGYLSASRSLMARSDERQIDALLREEFGVEGQTTVFYSEEDVAARKKITVKIRDFGIYGEDEHINIMSKIEERLQKVYACEVEVS